MPCDVDGYPETPAPTLISMAKHAEARIKSQSKKIKGLRKRVEGLVKENKDLKQALMTVQELIVKGE